MSVRRFVLFSVAPVVLGVALSAQSGPVRGGLSSIQATTLEEWLTYIASDELQGREVYSEGLGLAASYIADHLKQWGVKPGMDDGTYFQTVKVVGVRNASRSTVTVEVNGRKRTFAEGEGISLPRNMGGRRTLTGDDLQFVGYGLQIPAASLNDYRDVDPKGKIVIWLGASGPKAASGQSSRLLNARSRLAVDKGAIAVIAPPTARGSRGRRGAAPETDRSQPAESDREAESAADFTTVQRYDLPVAPVVTAQDELFEFLFSASDVTFSVLKDLAARQEPLPRFALQGVKVTIDVAPEYSVVTTRLSRNVVAMIEGTDPKLKDTFVAFGAHYDHIGYQETQPAGRDAPAANPGGCTGQTRPTPRSGDIINNGADDDGSGTVALMAIARAFALGPKPKRSLLFVWHTGEESGLQGSRYNADHPVVPNEKIVAQLNIDMIGRNRCDDPKEGNSVYLIGSDRISTELHNISEDVNAAMDTPLTLDYELNDPADPQALYTRSDHYSYAAKGIPVIFYHTGLHKDYHYLTDEIDKIEFEKMTRITQLVYATGRRLADLDHAPARDNKGPRAVKGKGGRIK
jgi:Zn-dependent M28 family amino/carboxypeptidase